MSVCTADSCSAAPCWPCQKLGAGLQSPSVTHLLQYVLLLADIFSALLWFAAPALSWWDSHQAKIQHASCIVSFLWLHFISCGFTTQRGQPCKKQPLPGCFWVQTLTFTPPARKWSQPTGTILHQVFAHYIISSSCRLGGIPQWVCVLTLMVRIWVIFTALPPWISKCFTFIN